jgi:hypothetical protein
MIQTLWYDPFTQQMEPDLSFPPVLTKADGSRRYREGEFGNASPSWDNYDEFIANAPRFALYHLRNGAVAGGKTYYKQTRYEAWRRWIAMADFKDWFVSMQIPYDVERTLQIQGEVMDTEQGLSLFYTHIAKPMRDALREEAHSVYGIIAYSLLRTYLCANSYEWLMELLRRYSGHVVEFSTFGRKWGTVLHYNTVFWEVRNY